MMKKRLKRKAVIDLEETQEQIEIRSRRPELIYIATFLGALLLAAALFVVFVPRPSTTTSTGAGTGTGPSPAQVAVLTAAPRLMTVTAAENAMVIQIPDAPVTSQQAGWVRGLRVRQGSSVRAGEPVAMIEPANSASQNTLDAYQMAVQNLQATSAQISILQNALAEAQNAVQEARTRVADETNGLMASQSAERQAETALQVTTDNLQNQEKALANSQALFDQGVISKHELDLVQQARNQAKAQSDQAQASLAGVRAQGDGSMARISAAKQAQKAAETRVIQLRRQLSQTNQIAARQAAGVKQLASNFRSAQRSQQMFALTAPTDGVVSNVSVKPGTLVTPGMAILTIKKPDTSLAVMQSSGQEAAMLKPGQPGSVRLQGKETPYAAKVVAVEPAPSGQGATRALIAVSDPKKQLKPGSMVLAQMILGKARGVKVPIKSLVATKTGPAVWVAQNQVARLRNVRVLRASNTSAVITGGLQPGDMLIVRFEKPLKDGTPVTITPAA